MKRSLNHLFTHSRPAAGTLEHGSPIEGRETGMALIVAAVVVLPALLLLLSSCTDTDTPASATSSHTPQIGRAHV